MLIIICLLKDFMDLLIFGQHFLLPWQWIGKQRLWYAWILRNRSNLTCVEHNPLTFVYEVHVDGMSISWCVWSPYIYPGVCGGQRTTLWSQFFPSNFVWVLGFELRSSGLAASAFIHWASLPTHIPLLNGSIVQWMLGMFLGWSQRQTNQFS